MLIETLGIEAYGEDWPRKFGVTVKDLAWWRKKQAREAVRRGAGVAEPRLIYFSTFFDLERIVLDNWTVFEPVFGDSTRTGVYLEKLRELRNPDAHHRALTTSEKALIEGIAGELRTQITRHMSRRDTPDEYFPVRGGYLSWHGQEVLHSSLRDAVIERCGCSTKGVRCTR